MSANKVVLITGATGGIGKATALLLAKSDSGPYDLALHYNSAPQSTRDALLSDLQSANPQIRAHFFQADLSTYDAVRQLHEDVTEALHKIDILFANAGSTLGVSNVSSLSDVSIDVMEKTWRVNAGGPMLLTQLCLPEMEAQGYGRVVLCSSVAGLTGGVVGPHYASSKSALHGFVHWLGGNVARKGVTVNAVAPALVGGTAMLPGDEGGLAGKIPVGRLGKPEEIAETVLWLIKTGYVTKKIIAVDGGMFPH